MYNLYIYIYEFYTRTVQEATLTLSYLESEASLGVYPCLLDMTCQFCQLADDDCANVEADFRVRDQNLSRNTCSLINSNISRSTVL